MRNSYGKGKITKNEVKTFLDNKRDLHVKFNKKIEYKPNQNCLSCKFISFSWYNQEFTKDNPRILLRITFFIKIIDSKKSKEYLYS